VEADTRLFHESVSTLPRLLLARLEWNTGATDAALWPLLAPGRALVGNTIHEIREGKSMPRVNQPISPSLKWLLFASPVGFLLVIPQATLLKLVAPIGGVCAVWLVCIGIETAISRRKEQAAKSQAYDDSGEGKRCPFCCEEIKPGAILCRFCGSNLKTSTSNTLAVASVLVTLLAVYCQLQSELNPLNGSIRDLDKHLTGGFLAECQSALREVSNSIDELKSQIK
jgi:hypothetical protein